MTAVPSTVAGSCTSRAISKDGACSPSSTKPRKLERSEIAGSSQLAKLSGLSSDSGWVVPRRLPSSLTSTTWMSDSSTVIWSRARRARTPPPTRASVSPAANSLLAEIASSRKEDSLATRVARKIMPSTNSAISRELASAERSAPAATTSSFRISSAELTASAVRCWSTRAPTIARMLNPMSGMRTTGRTRRKMLLRIDPSFASSASSSTMSRGSSVSWGASLMRNLP